MDKKALTNWLGSLGKDREWLAGEIGSAKGTVDQWFSKGFPEWAEKSIERLMNPPGNETAGLEVTFTARQFERIEQARQLVGLKRKEFYEEAITELTDKILAEEQQPQESPGTRRIIQYPEAVEHLGSRHHGTNEERPIKSAADLRAVIKKHGG